MQVKTTHLFLWATLGLLLALMVLGPVQAYPRGCAYGRANRVEDVKKCQYGWEMDPCGNKVCTKGPGEVCGGKHQRYGVCGEGLMCSNCLRCQGCSLKTFECFDDPHCIWSVP